MKEKIVYNYERREDIKKELFYRIIEKLYSISYPKPSVSFDVMAKMSQTLSKGKYQYPIDFYYLPNDVLKDVVEDFLYLHNICLHWKNNMEFLMEALFEKGGIKEVYSKTDWSEEPLRHCEDVKTLENYIPKESAEKVKEILEGYKKTYKIGQRDYNEMTFSIFNYSPNTNRERVINAWKEVFDKTIEIPEDNNWIDEYQYEEECEN